MEPVLFILLITIAGSSGFGIFSQCDISLCTTLTPDDVLRVVENFPPNEEELREICPPLLEAIECFLSLAEECIIELYEELRASENVTMSQLISTIRNGVRLIIDVCDQESQLGRDFRASAPCLKKVFSERNVECATATKRLYDVFRFPEDYDAEEIMALFGDKLREEMRCLTVAYEMACNLKSIEKTCGSVARDVLLEVVDRTNMLSMGICSEDSLLNMNEQYLDFLEEQKRRAFFANAFEFRKRRK